MSKKYKQLDPVQNFRDDTNGGYVLSYNFVEGIIGKQMEIIEAIGIPDKQEQSIKNLLKKVIFSLVYDGHSTAIISEKLYWEIRDVHSNNKKEGLPTMVKLEDIK